MVMVYLETAGFLQFGAAYGGLRGLQILPSPRHTTILAIALVAVGIVYFFSVPLWIDGPWGAEMDAPSVTGAEGRQVGWRKSSLGDLARARALNDIDGGLSGGSQGIYFPLTATMAVFSTLAVASLRNRRRRSSATDPLSGLGMLESNPWSRSVGPSMKAWRKEWRSELAHQFAPSNAWGGVASIVRWRRGR